MQTNFGGLNHTDGARDGEIWDMKNMSSDNMPLASTREKRWRLASLRKPNGIFGYDGLLYVDGQQLFYNFQFANVLTDSKKHMVAVGRNVYIWPDKKSFNLDTKVVTKMEKSYVKSGLVFGNGTYAGVDAKLNSITTKGKAFPFKVGDAIHITGCTVEPKNNKVVIIREISDDKKTLRFSENTFAKEATESGEVTLAIKVPDLEGVFESKGRIWGYEGNKIWASKSNDPTNFWSYDGISTSAWEWDCPTPGPFTGCIKFRGYPMFFKEEVIYKIYGERTPSSFECLDSATLGVMEGCGDSLAIAGDTLFYMSKVGVMAYTMGLPAQISSPLGNGPFLGAVGGSDGLKYYVDITGEGGKHAIHVYDTQRGVWHKEDDFQISQCAYSDGLYAVSADGRLIMLGATADPPASAAKEGNFESFIETADYTWLSPEKKYPLRMNVRLEADAGTGIAVSISYDSSGIWEHVKGLSTDRKRSFEFPVPIRRCDHYRIRIDATGPWTLYSMGQTYYKGSDR